jgi:plastocyanin
VRTSSKSSIALLFLATLLTGLASGCGGGSDGSPAAPSPAPENPNRITISATGAVSPTELVVPPGTRVLFINNHTQEHHMASDPHPDHTDCPEINQVGLLTAGQSRETGNLVTVRTCGFHDHMNPGNASLRGRIVIR